MLKAKPRKLAAEKRDRGRPSHQATKQNKRLVEILAGFGISDVKICYVLDITRPTLAKHYADELVRGPPLTEANLIGNLVRLSKGDGGTALKATLFALQARFGWTVYAPPPRAREPGEPDPVPIADAKLGKKEQAELDAQTAHENSEWADLVEPDQERAN